jgi:hypothetical protein
MHSPQLIQAPWTQIEELPRVVDIEKGLVLSREFFALWKNVDSDLLLRRQAGAECEKLNGRSTAAPHWKATGHDRFSICFAHE